MISGAGVPADHESKTGSEAGPTMKGGEGRKLSRKMRDRVCEMRC